MAQFGVTDYLVCLDGKVINDVGGIKMEMASSYKYTWAFFGIYKRPTGTQLINMTSGAAATDTLWIAA